ncbi:MAG: ATP-binding protein [Myxococcota bacterium]|jgi:signal transduction histidine kinase/CheY-like chemotaxis protein|nr:ATP-binding protein [Myxococcota bacterium]
MNIWSIPPLVIAAITFYAGTTHAFMYFRRLRRGVNLSFSALCLFSTSYALLSAGLFNAQTVAEGSTWQLGQVVAVPAICAALVWFVSEYTGAMRRWLVNALGILSGALCLLAVLVPRTLTFDPSKPAEKIVELFGSTVVYHEGEAGAVVGLLTGVGFLYYGYVFILAGRFLRSDTKRRAWPLVLTLCAFFGALVNDAAVVFGLYLFPYLIEYAFLCFAILMAHALSLEMLEASATQIALEQSEQQLQQAHKMEAIGRLAGGIAHDFNNLLVPILGYAELAQRRMAQTDPAYEKLTKIREAAEQAKSLTQQFLAFGRRQVLQMHIVNINDVLLNMKRILRHLIEEGIHIEVHISEALGNVKADSVQLQQVVMNLAVNARDAMPNGGLLRITTRDVILDKRTATQLGIHSGRYAVLSVSDTGVGMSPEIISRAFEPFYTTKEPGKGTGLGLSMVYGIAKQHEGAVTVRSTPGEGSIFEVLLPVTQDDTTPVRVEPRRQRGPTGSPATVLVVEDDPAVRGLVTDLLEENGYRVISARDGAEGLRLAEEVDDSIDLLLTDVVLPKLDGRELSRRLMEARPCLKVLFMSGYTDDVMSAPREEDEDLPFLSKPFSTDTLVGRVRELLDRVEKNKE